MAGGVFDTNGTCTALGQVGAACSPFGTGVTNLPNCNWLDRLGCIAGRCESLPVVAVGAACGFDAARCAGSALCVSGTCRAVAGEGELCDDTISCGPYAVCIDNACRFTEFDDACYPDEPATPGL